MWNLDVQFNQVRVEEAGRPPDIELAGVDILLNNIHRRMERHGMILWKDI